VQGKQDMGGQTKFAHRFSRQLAQGLDFQVAPGAARLSSLNEPAQLGLNTSRELSASCSPAASGEKGRAAVPMPTQPEEEVGTLRIASQPVQT
ncbi:MAG: hypothetical protein WB543_09515, partial [Candidatus Acidiferrum sp.]